MLIFNKKLALRLYNTFAIFSFLLFNVLYYSEVGGPESIYRKIMFIIGGGFLYLNPKFIKHIAYLFFIPILFVLISLLYNFQTITIGSINATFFTILGLLFMSMKPVDISILFMRKLIVISLIISLIISLVYVVKTLEISKAYYNFNINPNQAGIFFYICITAALYFIQTWRRVLIILPNYLLIVTTGSRAAFICSSFLLFFTELFIERKENIEFFGLKRTKFIRTSFVMCIIFFGILYSFGDYFLLLFERLDSVGISLSSASGGGRDFIWNNVFILMNNSPASWIFGFGPSSIDTMIGDKSTHNSYIDAIATKGLPYLVFTMLALTVLVRYHLKKHHIFVVISIVSILTYGYTSSELFGGIGSLWGLIIFLSIWARSTS